MAIDIERSLMNATRKSRGQALGEPLGNDKLARDLSESGVRLEGLGGK